MKQQSGFDFNQQWFDMWMAQSKAFFTSAQTHFGDVFGKQGFANPLDHRDQIEAWLNTLKSQWNTMNLNESQQPFEKYWKTMSDLSLQASDLMMKEWIKRTEDKKPVHDMSELYELWLNCCHEVYAKAMKSADYQSLYGEFMNQALKYWKSAMPK